MSYFRPPHPHSWPARATTQLPPDTRNPNAQTRWQANIPAGLPDSRLWPEPAECYRIDKSWTQFWLVKTGQMRESFIGWITLKFPMRGDKQSPTLWLIVLCSRPRITRTTTVCPSIQRSSAAFPSRTTYRYPTGSGPNTPGSSSSSTTTSWKDTRLPETSWKRWRTRPSKKCWIFNANSESMSLRMARYAANRTYFTFAGAFRVSTLTTWFPRVAATERSWVRCRWLSAKWKRKAMLLG